MTIARLQPLLRAYQKRVQARRQLQSLASQALSLSKQAIFALLRHDVTRAHACIEEAQKLLRQGSRIVQRDSALLDEGVLRAALEECSEAIFVYGYRTQKRLDALPLPTDDPEILIAGLADCLGELARFAVMEAIDGRKDRVEEIEVFVRNIVEMLLKLDLTGSLRTKFDQTRQHLRKIEDVRYDMSRRV